jgi:hypothetical protein
MNQLRSLLLLLIILIFPTVLFSQVPLNWTRDEINPGDDFTLAPDESIFTEGTKSLHMQLNSGSVPYLLSDVFYLTPGVDFEFSIDVFDNDTAGTIKIYADFYDTYGFNIYGQPPVLSADSSEWQTIRWQGTIPDQAVVGFILVKFYTQPDFYHFTREADIWIDNVQFNQAGTGNLVANDGFEDWNVGIGEPGKKIEVLSIYPNPASDYININLPDDVQNIFISDMTGMQLKMLSGKCNEHIRVDISLLPKGIYQVIVLLDNNSILREKLIKF